MHLNFFKGKLIPIALIAATTTFIIFTLRNRVVINNQRVLCMVLATNGTLENRGVAIWKTWGKQCDKTLFACNCPNRDYMIPILHLDVVESYTQMANKVLTLLKTVYRKHIQEFDYFLLTDDDTYIFVDNLRKFISTIRRDEPLTYGYNFAVVLANGYHSGGAGILITRESLRRMSANVEKGICNTNLTDGFGDIAIGLCAEKSNVTMGNSLDELGRERFHPLSPVEHYRNPYHLEWYAKNKPKNGSECCSEESISFHYVSSEEMYKISKLTSSKISTLFKYL